jgi:thiamine biosynthesis lipoprotein
MMIQLARHAMATRFDLVLHGTDRTQLHDAGEAALDEVERLEEQLSFFRPTSELAAVNRWAAGQPIKVEGRLIRLLQRCKEVSEATGGAFDPTIGPVIRLLRHAQTDDPIDAFSADQARAAVGFDGMVIDPDAGTVRFARPGMALDLGAAGRGYALDRAIAILRERGVTSAMLDAGATSVHVIGTPPGEPGWRVELKAPAGSASSDRVLALVDQAVAISGRQGRSGSGDPSLEGHVRDPRTGDAVAHTLAAAVIGPNSFMCDMLSTALMVGGARWLPVLASQFPGYEGWVAEPALEHLA